MKDRRPLPLTPRQKEIMDYLRSFIGANGFAPSFEEIAKHFRLGSLATVHEHLTNLEIKGHIVRRHAEARAIEVYGDDEMERLRTLNGALLTTIRVMSERLAELDPTIRPSEAP